MTSLFEEWIQKNLERNDVDGTVIFDWINNWINQDITWVVDTRQNYVGYEGVLIST